MAKIEEVTYVPRGHYESFQVVKAYNAVLQCET